MASLLVPGVHLHRNPQFKPALDALVVFLLERDYSNHARWSVYDHAATHGTLAGTPYLDPEDEAAAEAIFVGALPEIPFDSAAWDRPDAFLDAEMLAEGCHPEPFLPPGEDEPTGEFPAVVVALEDGPDAPDDPAFFGPTRVAALNLPPISGGAPEEMPPDVADAHYAAEMERAWEEYAAWSAALSFPRTKDRHDVARDIAEELHWWNTNA